MKTTVQLLSVFICIFIFTTSSSAFVHAPKVNSAVEQSQTITNNDLVDLSRKELETKMGRKLKFGERIAIGIVKRKLKQERKRAGNNEPGEVKMDGLGIAGFVCGVVGIFTFGLLSILAIVFSAIALGRINRDPERIRGKGLAIAGLVLGVLSVLLLTTLIVVGLLIL